MHFQKTEEILNTCAVYAVKFNPTTWQQRWTVSDRGGRKCCLLRQGKVCGATALMGCLHSYIM